MARRGKGEGSIYQRADGRWIGNIDCGFIDGRRVRKVYSGQTRKAVADKLASALGKRQRGGVVNTDDVISVGSHLDSWLATVSVRPKTRRQYEQAIRLYLKPAIGPVRLARLDAPQVRAMCRGMEERGLSTRTATLARDVLRIALSQAVTDDLIARNVAKLVRRPKPTRRDGATLSADDARVLLDALAGRRLETVITCGLALGLRLGEVLGLQWTDVDLTHGRLNLRQALQTTGSRRDLAPLKSEQSRRTLRLPEVVVRAFERHHVWQAERRLAAGAAWQKSDFVFTTRVGRPLDGPGVTRDLKTLLAHTWRSGRSGCKHRRVREGACLDCGATHLPVMSFHALRHSCASLLLAAGVPMRDMSELLGHSDIRLTLSTYAHVLDEGRARTASVIDQVFDSPNRVANLVAK